MKKIVYTLYGVVGIFVIYLTSLFFLQDKMLFKPDNNYVSPQEADLYDVSENMLTMSDGTKVMTWMKEGDKNLPAILFFHGNRGQIAEFAPQIRRFNSDGYGIFLAEYRGYGNSEGKINQDKMFSDGAEIYDWIKKKGYSKIIVIGYSFGCAASIGLAGRRNVDGLVLISPFASLSRLVAEKYLFSNWILKDDYPSEKTIQKLTAPILIIHGTGDTLVPVHHAKILYKQRSNNTSLHLLDGKDHREVFWANETPVLISDWLSAL
ncbi:MAG: alpha/beta fold hydrolase [Alphaproteobacteria bacterium]|nr:alpha/beta fold hydrolase [Alphaproteobacteria bacterium]